MTFEAAHATQALAGRIALVTGAASGIGRAQAKLFATSGATVIAVDHQADALTDTVREITAGGDRAEAMVADLADGIAIANLVERVQTNHGRIDILGNTAGMHDGYRRSLETDDMLWDRISGVNVKAVFRLTNAVLPGMLARGNGTIVNVASVSAFVAGGGGPAYTASKHAVVGYTRQLAHEYGRKGIRVNAVCPGMVETGMTRDVLSDPESGFVKAVRAVPAGRYAQPEDIAKVALFLASEASSFMHGAAVLVDGGLTVK